jgi:hypothetical protein
VFLDDFEIYKLPNSGQRHKNNYFKCPHFRVGLVNTPTLYELFVKLSGTPFKPTEVIQKSFQIIPHRYICLHFCNISEIMDPLRFQPTNVVEGQIVNVEEAVLEHVKSRPETRDQHLKTYTETQSIAKYDLENTKSVTVASTVWKLLME